MNCALGISQLKRIKSFLKKRKHISKKYKTSLFSLKKKKLINFLPKTSEAYSSNHLFILNINFKKIRKTKDDFFKYMLKNKIICQYHYIPMYKFNHLKNLSKKLTNTEKYFNNSVSLPIFYELNDKQQKKIVKVLFSFFNKKLIYISLI